MLIQLSGPGASRSPEDPQPGSSRGGSSGSSSSSSNPQEGGVMPDMVASNPDLEELEIIAVKFDSVFQRNRFINPKQPQFNPW